MIIRDGGFLSIVMSIATLTGTVVVINIDA